LHYSANVNVIGFFFKLQVDIRGLFSILVKMIFLKYLAKISYVTFISLFILMLSDY